MVHCRDIHELYLDPIHYLEELHVDVLQRWVTYELLLSMHWPEPLHSGLKRVHVRLFKLELGFFTWLLICTIGLDDYNLDL